MTLHVPWILSKCIPFKDIHQESRFMDCKEVYNRLNSILPTYIHRNYHYYIKINVIIHGDVSKGPNISVEIQNESEFINYMLFNYPEFII